jgi:hypothetical protein
MSPDRLELLTIAVGARLHLVGVPQETDEVVSLPGSDLDLRPGFSLVVAEGDSHGAWSDGSCAHLVSPLAPQLLDGTGASLYSESHASRNDIARPVDWRSFGQL